MANPRKFSEKIALHNQKQAEETAAFEQIMREVSDATSRVNALPKQHLLINQTLGSYRGGSLPNVNNIGSNSVDFKRLSATTSGRKRMKDPYINALSNLEEIQSTRVSDYRDRSRTNVGPIRQRTAEKRVDTSPYNSSSYLSPPPDTSWRRTNSDSALHQSAMNISTDSTLHSSGSQRRITDGQLLGIVVPDPNDPNRKQFVASQDGRPRSSCEVPRVPGINIYPSQHEPGTIQIPIGNSTGSLPDLTNVHFTSPLPNPIDHEDHSSSPYSTNHLSVPSLVNSRYLHTCKGVTVDSSNAPLESFQQSQYVYQQQQSPPSTQQQQSPQQHQQQRQQTQPPSQQQQQQSSQQQNQPSQQSPCSPSLISTSQNITSHLNSLSTYRSPQPLSRPSPQTSPGLIVQGSPLVYRSGSPGDTSHSGPQSPVSPASPPGVGPNSSPFLEHNNYYFSQAQAAALQQHFEQFSMVDNPVTTYISTQNNTTHYSQAISHGSPDDGLTQVGNQELSTDPGYYSQSPSQLQYNRPVTMNPSGGSTQQTTPQTPNTPSSIPDIILTDFSSSTGDDLSRHEFVKDLGSAMSGSFDTELFPSDETLREGLDPIDLAGLQMLTDPDMNVITDPATEDNFRLDRL